ncbi:predicted protein [Nematostella vectensis]|uniref:Uncharacterized protein n=1 Tax=Nematostella vectensis TaxID=45351 RepID=A7SZC1_NEMVE|nr:predicted protein [Nematostella vectensis]|eukprot:XP_001623034.1 predicted protein [Nematostella vectensis]
MRHRYMKMCPVARAIKIDKLFVMISRQANKRAQAFAEGYLEKVRSALLKSYPEIYESFLKTLVDSSMHGWSPVQSALLKSYPEIYESFLKTLVDSSMHGWSPVQLYKRMEAVLLDFPELIENFIAFLEPDQAVLAEVSMKNLQFVKARTFFRKLEVRFDLERLKSNPALATIFLVNVVFETSNNITNAL